MVRLICVASALFAGLGCTSDRPPARTPAALVAEGDAATLHRLAAALAAEGDLVRAEQYALFAVNRGLPMETALPLLLSVCVRASRISAALHHAEPVLRAHPDDHRLRYVIASLYFALSRREDAARALMVVLQAQPDHVAAGQLLALLQEVP